MQTSLFTSIETLALVAEASRTLHNNAPFALRLQAFFNLLQPAIAYRDARLTCWFQSNQPETVQQQFFSPNAWAYPWDDNLAQHVGHERQLVRQTLAVNAANDGGSPRTGGHIIYLGIPIFCSGWLWGVIEFRSQDPIAFDEEAQDLMLALVPQLAAAIAEEGARQEHPPVRQHCTLMPSRADDQHDHVLTVFSRELEELSDLQTLLNLLLQWAREATGAEAGTISLVDHQRGELVLQVYEGYESTILATSLTQGLRQRWSWDIGLAGQVAQSGRAKLVRDVTQEPNLRPTASDLQTELAVPIKQNSMVLAVLVLDSPRAAAFDEAALAFVSTLCECATRPLYRALKYQEAVEISNQLSQVFTSMPMGLALLDTNGRILRINAAWTTTWGLSHPPAEDQSFHIPLDLVDALLSRLVDPLRLTEFCITGQRTLDEVQITTVRLHNPTQELQVLSVPTRDRLGQITGRLWAVSDVTREREVDRLKNEFVSIVSHELRTPLTSILGYTELLLARDFDPSDQRQFIQTVYDQAMHLSQLVEDLLGVSRLDAGKVKLNRWVITLRQVIAELTNQLNAQLDRHRLLIRLADPLPPVYVDRDKVKQILFNLLTNAIKYSPNGGEIELTVQETPTRLPNAVLPVDHPPGRWLVVSVRDQGIGIAPEDVARIWERFYRVDNTNTRRIGGTGLGLSITRGLVELHGGRIWVESVISEGSVFSFTLPVATSGERRG